MALTRKNTVLTRENTLALALAPINYDQLRTRHALLQVDSSILS